MPELHPSSARAPDCDRVVFMAGTLSDGFTVIGPYISWDAAIVAHERDEGWFMTIYAPSESPSVE